MMGIIKFKIGDKVVLIEDYVKNCKKGLSGTVIDLNPSYNNEDGGLITVLTKTQGDFTCFGNRLALKEEPKTTLTALTLPTDSEARKEIPMFSGCLRYFPAAIAGVAKISKAGNDKHNPGQELHHDRSKSLDHPDCILRHLTDLSDELAKLERGENTNPEKVLAEVSALAWRALALSQVLHEKYDGAPLAPGAK